MVDARGASKGSGLFDLECDFACEFLNHGDNVRCNYFALKSRLSQPLANPKKPPSHHQRGLTPLSPSTTSQPKETSTPPSKRHDPFDATPNAASLQGLPRKCFTVRSRIETVELNTT